MRPGIPAPLPGLLLLLLLVPALRAQEEPEGTAPSEAGGIVEDERLQRRVEKACAGLAEDIEALLGERFEGPVPVRIVTREFIREFAKESARKQTPEGGLELAQRMAERLRLVPEGYDLMGKQLELLEQQVAGLYDPDRDTYYVVDQAGQPPSPMFMITAAHELVHAYRDVGGDYWERTVATIDEDADWAIAITCLVEGDATLLGQPLGIAAVQRQDPVPLLDHTASRAAAMAEQMRMAAAMAGLSEFPFAVREMLLGRYAIGLEFAAAIYEARGLEGLAAAYAQPPRSTEQVLHPEKYLAETPDEPTIFSGGDPTAALGEGWTLSLSGTSGEFDTQIQFTEVLGREAARVAAEGWDGARFFFVEKEGEPAFVGGISTWDSDEDAREFASAWAEWASRRDGADPVHELAREADRFQVTTSDGLVVVDVRGGNVLVADGVPADRVEAVLAALASAGRRDRGADENLAAAGD